jgi:bisphosphoglycerate-dependent phosphoglycerate mutase
LDEVIRIWLKKLKTSKYFKELIFKTLLFPDDQFIISDTENNLQKAVNLLNSISKEYNLEIATKKDEGIAFRWDKSLKNKNCYKL